MWETSVPFYQNLSYIGIEAVWFSSEGVKGHLQFGLGYTVLPVKWWLSSGHAPIWLFEISRLGDWPGAMRTPTQTLFSPFFGAFAHPICNLAFALIRSIRSGDLLHSDEDALRASY